MTLLVVKSCKVEREKRKKKRNEIASILIKKQTTGNMIRRAKDYVYKLSHPYTQAASVPLPDRGNHWQATGRPLAVR